MSTCLTLIIPTLWLHVLSLYRVCLLIIIPSKPSLLCSTSTLVESSAFGSTGSYPTIYAYAFSVIVPIDDAKTLLLFRTINGVPDDVAKRMKMVTGLEGAELAAVRKTMKQSQSNADNTAQVGVEGGAGTIPDQFRPTHRVNPLPLPIPLPCIGKKVDSIKYYQDQIEELNQRIHDQQHKHDGYKPVNSAFIEFNQQIAAHMAAQSLAHHKVMAMNPRHIEIAPEDIEWSNMNIDPWFRMARQFISYCCSGAIIIFWAIPGGHLRPRCALFNIALTVSLQSLLFLPSPIWTLWPRFCPSWLPSKPCLLL